MIMSLNPTVAPSGTFILSNWKISLPVESSEKISSRSVEIFNLKGYESRYFYTGFDGVMVFRAPVDGAVTGGLMPSTLEADAARMRDNRGQRIVIGQIHGRDDELVRLYGQDN